jgi:hypothetical protein
MKLSQIALLLLTLNTSVLYCTNPHGNQQDDDGSHFQYVVYVFTKPIKYLKHHLWTDQQETYNQPMNEYYNQETIELCLNRIKQDLQHLPQEDLNNILNNLYAQLKVMDTPSVIQDKTHKVLVNYKEAKTEELIIELEAQGLYIDSNKRQSFIDSQKRNLKALLKKTNHLDSEKIADHFGEKLEKTITEEILNPTYQGYYRSKN